MSGPSIDVKTKQFDLLINGKIVPSGSGQTFDSVNPSNGDVFAQIANASKEDMVQAIAAARKAFDGGPWPAMSVAERGIYLKKIATLIRKYAKELAEIEMLDAGKTMKHSTFIDVPTCAETFEYFGSLSNQLEDQENSVAAPVKSSTRREPLGVIGCIIPWNYPLIMFGWKVAPALIAGNTVVFKPSSSASCSILKLAQILQEVGLPEGVLNIVATKDITAAEELNKSKDVDMVTFTGGTETGQHILRLASDSAKKVSPELGGKSPNIVFADCDQKAALGGTMSAIFMNQGQMCTAGSRLLLEESIYDDFLKQLIEKTKSLKIGDAAKHDTQFGPLVSVEHRDKVLRDIKKGVEEGAKIACGGKIPDGLKEGAYLEPTILTDVESSMHVAQEEIFGPVLCVLKFKDEQEAIRIANDSKFGLAASVWTKDKEKAERVSKELKCGTVWANTYGGFYNEAAFGGYKQSGFGRELGLEGLFSYTQSKHVCIDQTPGGMPLAASWF